MFFARELCIAVFASTNCLLCGVFVVSLNIQIISVSVLTNYLLSAEYLK